MDVYAKRINAILKSKHVRHGLPFVVFVIGGAYGLKEFASTRYQFSTKKSYGLDEVEALKVPQESIEEAYNKYKSTNIDNWQNIRGPRPWEDSKEMQAEQRKQLTGQNTLMAGLMEKAEKEKK